MNAKTKGFEIMSGDKTKIYYFLKLQYFTFYKSAAVNPSSQFEPESQKAF